MSIIQSLAETIGAMSLIEIAGVLTGIAGVWLAAKQNIWTWPLSLVSVAMYVLVFYRVRLYADMGLQVFYFVTSIYGWYLWLYGGKNHTEMKVNRAKRPELILLLFLSVLFTAGLGYFLDNYTDADLSYTDSATTAVSLAGYWLMAKKRIENWIVWLVVDVAYVGIYAYKELYLTSFLYFIFLLICVKGYLGWKKEYERLQQDKALLKAS